MPDTETRTDLQRLIDWLKTYTGYDILGNFQVDYTDQIPSNGAVFPQGLQEVERTETILGDITLTNQYNFGLYFTFEKSAEDDVAAKINADWLMGFQRWVQEQNARRLVPNFGNTQTPARASAQNGQLFSADGSGTAIYMVTLSVTFEQFYRAPFTTDDHVRLANVLHNIKGRFLLSYNDCPLVHDLYGDCQIEPLTRLNQLPAAGPTEYKELLICNYL